MNKHKGSKIRTMQCCIVFDWLNFHYFLQLMSVGLACKSAAKSDEKLVNQNYKTLFLSWMPLITQMKAAIEVA